MMSKPLLFFFTLLFVTVSACSPSGSNSSDQLPVTREACMAECPVFGTVESKDYNEVHVFRPDQDWVHEEPVASFRIKKGHFSGTALLDTTLVYEFIFTVPGSGMAKVRPFVPSQTGVSIACPEDMFGPIVLQSTSPENTTFIEFEEIGKSLIPVTEPINQKYKQLMNDRKLYTDEVYALIAEADTASRERAEELWSRFRKMQKLDESYSSEGLAVKHERDSISAVGDSLVRDYLAQHATMISSFYQVWRAIHSDSQFDNDTQPWLDIYDAHYAGRFPGHPYHTMIAALTENKVGDKIRDFTLPDAEGVLRKLSELVAGKMAVVDFWASWCGSCRIRSKALKPIYEKYAGDDFTIVGVANEYNDVTKWRTALKRDGYPWVNLVAVDGGPYIQSNHGKVFLIDQEGIILAIDPTVEEIEGILNSSLTE